MLEHQRNYNRIFTGSNQLNGYDNIHLGYNSDISAIEFKRDNITSFHMPFLAEPLKLTDSTLVAEGAEAGVIPAASDRIFKKQGNYGSSTPWGHNTGIQNGTWLCSWLYADENSKPRWLDRYYNPGAVTFIDALKGSYSLQQSTPYTPANPPFVDIPSQMILEPGVLYEYFHMGEKSAHELINTFSGNNNDRLTLSIQDYNSILTDTSIYGNKGEIKNFNYAWAAYETNTNYTSGTYLDFNNTEFINAKIDYSSTYSTVDEFSFNVFIRHPNWSNASNSQIIGNIFEGGYGLFYNNLNYFPYFVIPENTYGHLLYFNQERQSFLDQNAVIGNATLLTGNPIQISLNGERDIIVLNNLTDSSGYITSVIVKYNHAGDILSYYVLTEIAYQFAIDAFNNVIVFTGTTMYNFDVNLQLRTNTTYKYTQGQQIAFDQTGRLQTQINCKQLLYDNNNNKWTIENDDSVTFNSMIVTDIPAAATNLAVDPNGDVWVLYGSNQVVTINPKLITKNVVSGTVTTTNNDISQLVNIVEGSNTSNSAFVNNYDFRNAYTNTFMFGGDLLCNQTDTATRTTTTTITTAGKVTTVTKTIYSTNYNSNTQTTSVTSVSSTSPRSTQTTTMQVSSISKTFYQESTQKNISFIRAYNRSTNIHTWYALVYVNYDQALYTVTLNGEVVDVTFLNTAINLQDAINENPSDTTFSGVGDFTGYEWSRVFNKIKYNNTPQLQFKMSTTNGDVAAPYNTQILSVPVSYFGDNTWYSVTGTYKNHTLKLYVNNLFLGSLTIPGNQDITYTFHNNFFIGTQSGKTANLNTEINSNALIFNGHIGFINIYNYAIESSFIQYFIRSKVKGQSLIWSIPTANLQYIETIERFFKHKLPGAKSQFFNIRISGSQIKDENTRTIIENYIRSTITQLKPAHTDLLAIEWV